MADFPSKVSTETSAPSYQNNTQAGSSTMVDVFFLKSIPAILMMVEVVLGMITWAPVASGPHTALPALGWILFVTITAWLLTIILFCLILFGVLQKVPAVPWATVVMVYHGVITVLYFSAFVTTAAMVALALGTYHDNLAAAAFFGAVTTIAYAASTFFSFLDWRGSQGNAEAPAVPT